MLNRRLAIRTVGGIAAGILATGLVTVPAAAEPSTAGDPATAPCTSRVCDDGGDAGSGEGTIEVRVWGTGTTSGDDGYDIPSTTVTVEPTCYMKDYWTGEDFYEFVDSGRWNGSGGPNGESPGPPPAGWDEHGEDDGLWYFPTCSSGPWVGPREEFLPYAEVWMDTNGPVFVATGDAPPVGEVDPELLMEAAQDAMDLPEPTASWNPTRSGDAATFVNMETWVWFEDAPVDVEIFAEAAGNTAEVNATLDQTTLSAPTTPSVTCAGVGVPYAPGASSDCVVAFGRSSATQPGGTTTLTADMAWSVDWSYNGDPQGALDPQTVTSASEIPVAEVQAVVRR